MKHSLRSYDVKMKNESSGLQYFITDNILTNSCSQIRVMLIKSINTAKGEEK